MSRILQIPKRYPWEGKDAARRLTEALRTPYGTMSLREIQGAGLLEGWKRRGLFMQGRVGCGKTLTAGLLPVVWGSQRPLVLCPGNLVEKTERDFRLLREHWQIPRTIRIESYSKIGHPDHIDLLKTYRPDAVIADEAQKLKAIDRKVASKPAACAVRVHEYLRSEPTTCFAALSGSPIDESILESAPLLVWSLRGWAPVPHSREEQCTWASVLDAKVIERGDPSTLVELGCPLSIEDARAAYLDRLRSTEGVIISEDQFDGVGLTVEPIYLETPAALEPVWEELRELWVRHDGWTFADARFEVYAAARQLALGFYYHPNPWPPTDWFNARKAVARLCREVIEASDEWDSYKLILDAAREGRFGETSQEIVAQWDCIKDTFAINNEPVWLSDHALVAAERWGQGGGIVWTNYRAFAHELARRTGWSYFGEHGFDANGRYVEDVGDRTIILSAKANTEGRNLQYKWHRNLFTTPSTRGWEWEQRLGRTHRDGQTRDVTCDYFLGCREDRLAIRDATVRSDAVAKLTSQQYKIHAIGLQEPQVIAKGYAWAKTQKRKD